MLRGADAYPLFCSSTFSFNGHPPLGVNAPAGDVHAIVAVLDGFNGHPPLGVNAPRYLSIIAAEPSEGFNGHPPLGVNAP